MGKQILTNLCEGCLSVDRSLTTADMECSQMFYTFIDTKLADNIQLCWECRAILKKFIKYKQKFQKAQNILHKHSPKLISLSNLSINKCEGTKEIIYDDEIKSLSMNFIKIEDDFECYPDLNDSISDNDSQKINIKCDKEIEIEVENHENIKTDDFNDSDDEPLISRKEVTDEDDVIKKGEDAKMKGKREKPSGVIYNERINKKLQKLNMDSDQLQMVLLSWEEVEEERQKALESETFKRHGYRCYDCAIGFNHKCKLDTHMKKHDVSAGNAECLICHIRCRDKHALAAHKRRHRVRWRCALCGATWSRPSLGADHVARYHGGPEPIHECSICGQKETTVAKLRSHVKNHAERPKCELCGKTFRDRTSLRTHLFIHKGEKEYECPRCNKKFLFKKAMEIHLVTHDASAQLYCHLCDTNFKNKMSYNQHIKYNLKHIDPAKLKYACQLCDKKFVKATRLEEHNLAVHLKLTPITCTVIGCTFVCSSRTVLRTHTRMLHRNARLKRNHVCDVCGKTYTTKKCLEGHLRSHTGERPFHCSKCPASFGYEAALYNHNRLVHLRNKINRRNADWTINVPQPQPRDEEA